MSILFNEFHHGLLGFDRGLIDQHHGDVVLDRVHPVALIALERRTILDQCDRCLTVRARKYFEQFSIDGHV